jgi:hypothetical protein
MKIKTNKTFKKRSRIEIRKKKIRIKVEMPATKRVKMQFLEEKREKKRKKERLIGKNSVHHY